MRLTLLVERGDGTRAKFGMEAETDAATEQTTLANALATLQQTASVLRESVERQGVTAALPWQPIDPDDRTVVLE